MLKVAVLALALAVPTAGAAPAPALSPGASPARPTLSIAPTAPAIPAAEIEKLLPPRAVQADVMDVKSTPRYDQLVARMRASINANLEWWQAYRQKADARGVVPWDAKMGISKAEYDEMMTLATQLHLARVGATTLQFKRGADGSITLDGGAGAKELTGIRLTRDRKTVAGIYGTLPERQDVHQVDPAAPSGVWHGVEWNSLPAAAGSGEYHKIFLAIGRTAPSNRGLLFLSVRQIAGGKRTELSRIVSYPVAAP